MADPYRQRVGNTDQHTVLAAQQSARQHAEHIWFEIQTPANRCTDVALGHAGQPVC